ncbi:unnamed protein product, partial [Mesorhabditis belari]|uniref:peptidylprolyl isomerase n=1 Tax=Mesorhabditis belari TaxID=2138241 RepID=A0AAF3F5L6_9BILA
MSSDVNAAQTADNYSMVDNESDDLVEVFPSARACVSSGEPSLDGSIDDERGALSDSDITHAARTQTIATQVKGPSSDYLESSCRLEHEARERGDDWEDMLGSGELYKKTLKNGTGHHKVRDGQWITVKVVDTLRGVDSHDLLTFITGFSMVVDAWELAAKLMVEGEICALRTSSRFAYGENGLNKTIGPNQQMEYTIEILKIGDSPKYMQMAEDELCDFVLMLKDRGNFYFSRKEYEKAIFVYKRALTIVDTPEESEGLRKLFSSINSNLAVCYSKIDEWTLVEEHASTAISLHALNTKAYFHRALAYGQRGEIDRALADLRAALSIEPNEKSLQREIERVMSKKKEAREKEKLIFKKMVAGLSTEDYATPSRSLLASARLFLSSRLHLAVLSFFIVMLALFLHFLLQLW